MSASGTHSDEPHSSAIARARGRAPAGRCRLAVAAVWAGRGAGLSAAVAQADPVDQFAGRPITRDPHRLWPGRTWSDQRLHTLLDVRPGAHCRSAAVRETIVHLMGLGRFQDVRVDASATPGGVGLVVRAGAVRDVKRVVFRGDLGSAGVILRAAVVDRFGPTPRWAGPADIAAHSRTSSATAAFCAPEWRPSRTRTCPPGPATWPSTSPPARPRGSSR